MSAALTPGRPLVLVEASVVADVGYEHAVARLAADPARVVGAALARVRRRGESVEGRLRPLGWPSLLSKEVALQASRPRRHEDRVLVSLRWEARGARSLFPDLDADLQLEPEGITRTRVTLRGSYRPPFRGVGQFVDSLVLHRVGEATVQGVVVAIAGVLLDPDLPGSSAIPHRGEAAEGR